MKIMRYVAFAAALLVATMAHSQNFQSLGTASLSVTASSGSVALPAGNFGNNVTIQNIGSNEAFIAFGSSSVVATTSSEPVQASSARCFTTPNTTFIAAITASSTTTLRISQGTGPCSISYRGGASGGGSLVVAAGKTFTVNNTITLNGTDGAVLNIGSGGTIGPFTIGATTISGGTTNGLIYNAAGVAGNLTTGNSGVLVTSSGGVPSISSTLPSGIAATNMVLTTPALGVATATSINGNIITTGTGTLTLGSVTLNAGAGGTLGSNAFTSTAYAPLASPSFTGTVTFPDAGTWSSSGISGVVGISTTGGITATGNIGTSNAGVFFFTSRSSISSAANGELTWGTNNLSTAVSSMAVPVSNTHQFGKLDIASGAAAQIVTFQGNTASTTNGPLALIRGAGGGSSTSVGGELRLSGGLSSAAAGTGGAVTVYSAPAAAGNAAALIATFAANGNVSIATTTDASASSGSGSFQIAGGASVAKRFWIPAITASSGLQTAVLCQSSGGEMIADSVACLASSARFKNIRGSLSSDVVEKFMKLPIKIWSYKPEGIFKKGNWTRDRIGPIAEDVERLDSRLVEYDSEGSVRAYSTEQLLAYTIKVVQEQQVQIDALRTRQH